MGGETTISELYALVDKGGLVFVLLLVGLALVKGWLVPKWVYDALKAQMTTETVPKWAYDKLEQDCKQMTAIALRTTELAERNTTVAEKVLKDKKSEGKLDE